MTNKNTNVEVMENNNMKGVDTMENKVTLKQLFDEVKDVANNVKSLVEITQNENYSVTSEIVDLLNQAKAKMQMIYNDAFDKGIFVLRSKGEDNQVFVKDGDIKVIAKYIFDNGLVTIDNQFRRFLRRWDVREIFYIGENNAHVTLGYIRESDKVQAQDWIELVSNQGIVDILNESLRGMYIHKMVE